LTTWEGPRGKFFSGISEIQALSDGSLKAYEKHYCGLRYFLTLIKDFKSMLILEEDAP
jgi:hypothetical protein